MRKYEVSKLKRNLNEYANLSTNYKSTFQINQNL